MGDRFLELLIAFCVVLTSAAIVVATDPSWNWGDVPTWFTGLVALAALIAAWRAGSIARELLNVEREREDRAEDAEKSRRETEARAAQADRVAAWHVVEPDRKAPLGAPLRHVAVVRVRNGSPLPIWDTSVTIHGPDGSKREQVSVGIVAPDDELDVPWPRELRRSSEQDPRGMGEPVYIERHSDFAASVDFRDAAGRSWHRSAKGILRQTGITIFGEVAMTPPPTQARFKGSYAPSSSDAPEDPGSRPNA